MKGKEEGAVGFEFDRVVAWELDAGEADDGGGGGGFGATFIDFDDGGLEDIGDEEGFDGKVAEVGGGHEGVAKTEVLERLFEGTLPTNFEFGQGEIDECGTKVGESGKREGIDGGVVAREIDVHEAAAGVGELEDLNAVDFSVHELTFEVHHVDVARVAGVRREGFATGVADFKRKPPVGFEVEGVEEDEARSWSEDAGCEEVGDFAARFVSDPLVDGDACGVGIGEVKRADASLKVGGQSLQKAVFGNDVDVVEERVSDVEFVAVWRNTRGWRSVAEKRAKFVERVAIRSAFGHFESGDRAERRDEKIGVATRSVIDTVEKFQAELFLRKSRAGHKKGKKCEWSFHDGISVLLSG